MRVSIHSYLTVLTGIVLLSVSSEAWAGDALTLSVEEAVATALKNNHELIIGAKKVTEKESAVRELKASFLPQISGTATYTRLDVAPYISLGNSPMGSMMPPGTPSKITMGDDDVYDLGIAVQQPLFTGFALKNSFEIAKTALEAEKNSRAMSEIDVVYRTKKAFFELTKARDMGKVTGESVKLLEAHVADLERLLGAGLVTNNDLLKARVQLSEMKLTDLKAKNGARLAEKSLCMILGVPVDTEIATAVTEGSVKQSSFEGSIVTAALIHRPDLKYMSNALDMSRKAVSVARSSLFPQLAAVYNFNYKRPNREYEAEFYDSWTAGLVLQLNIFDWGKTKSRIDQAAMRRLQAEEQKKQLVDAIMIEAEQAALTMTEAEKRVVLAKETVAEAEENYRVTHDKFVEGLVSNTEVLDASTALVRAGVEYAAAVSDHRIAVAAVERTVGQRNTNAE